MAVAVFVALAPFARLPLPQFVAFLPAYQSALVVFDLVTAMLLLAQFRIQRTTSLQILAAGYVFSACLALGHAASFPGMLAPLGAIGGPQTTAWLYFFWHSGFAVFILGYGIARRTVPRGQAGSPWAALQAVAFAITCAALPIVYATAAHGWLPPIMSGDSDAPGKLVVALFSWGIGIAALWVLWRQRARTLLDLWLMVVLCVWIADTALAGVLNHARFDLGWYAGRIYGLLGNGFVLAVLLLESSTMYSRLARSNRRLAASLGETRRLNADLQAFAGSLAHDLQQPLITINSFAQLIRRAALPAADDAHLQRIMAATRSATGMVTALLEFARLGDSTLRRGPVELGPVVDLARAAVQPQAAGREVEWRVGALPQVDGDAALLQLVFVNLLSNALKYSRMRERTVVEIAAHRQARAWEIHVSDNGIGFDTRHAGRLFSPFERLHSQREFEGTGMGLANVRRIVQRHGGSVAAASVPGEGAVFTVVLPAAHGR